MDNNQCRRWLTTNQDEYRESPSVRINRYLESEEFGRYEDCMKARNDPVQEEDRKAEARHFLCCGEQCQNREPVIIPQDNHLSQEAKCIQPWCRCLATGDPRCYDEIREEKATEDLCQCKRCYSQMEPTPDNPRQKICSSTYFIDYRDPAFPYIHNEIAIKNKLYQKFKEYKDKADAKDQLKEPKVVPPKPDPKDGVDPNCLQIYDKLPEVKNCIWKPDERWWRDETDPCRKGIVKKYVWTSTYREMNKDGAALPLAVRELPTSCIERPPGDPVQRVAEMAPKSMMPLGEVFEKWDRPQVRKIAGRCDTMYNRPDLSHDSYFQEHRLCRAKYARCPEGHDVPRKENLELVRKNMLRQPYDRMIPGYGGYECFVTPPVCKVKNILNPADPYDIMSGYQENYIMHPPEVYASPVNPLRPSDLNKMGISTNPISTLGNIPLPCTNRLSCYLECDWSECPKGQLMIEPCCANN